MNPENAEEYQEWKLEPNHEFRFEVHTKNTVSLKLKTGRAEIFGTELAQETVYKFTGTKTCVFTYHGCTILISGPCTSSYVATETPMMTYLNTHIALEQLREDASYNANLRKQKKLMDQAGGGAGMQGIQLDNGDGNETGPVVLILGASDTGKTSLSKILLNYATKHDRRILFVDLDTNSGSVTVPGTLSATVFTKPLDAEEELGFSPVTTTTTPLVYYYGYSSPTDKPRLYTSLTKKLASVVKKKMDSDEEVKFAGMIIDTPSQFVEPAGYDLLMNAIEEFKGHYYLFLKLQNVSMFFFPLLVTAIFVLSNERLYSDLSRKFASSSISILKLAKSGGVVDRDKPTKRQEQMRKIKEYFYGSGKYELSPYSNIVSFNDMLIRQVGEGLLLFLSFLAFFMIMVKGSLAPSSALPIGMENKIQEQRMIKVAPSSILLHSVLAVSNAPVPTKPKEDDDKKQWSEEETNLLLDSNIAGFVYVSDVDENKGKLTLLTPGRLQKKYWLGDPGKIYKLKTPVEVPQNDLELQQPQVIHVPPGSQYYAVQNQLVYPDSQQYQNPPPNVAHLYQSPQSQFVPTGNHYPNQGVYANYPPHHENQTPVVVVPALNDQAPKHITPPVVDTLTEKV
ncbi:hypothetical protein HK098_007092 [Nowakowskiella sp. JEL0407]|nr:hypothetical protein HK098_007092 [Nowakowskiella sp. JEL0407]